MYFFYFFFRYNSVQSVCSMYTIPRLLGKIFSKKRDKVKCLFLYGPEYFNVVLHYPYMSSMRIPILNVTSTVYFNCNHNQTFWRVRCTKKEN